MLASVRRALLGLALAAPAIACAEGAPAARPDAGQRPDAGHGRDAGFAPTRTSSRATADDQARFLAGLPGAPGAPLLSLEQGAGFQKHVAELNASWAKLSENRLNKMGAWAKAEITPRIDPQRPLVYLFGGPDAITTDVVYPDAPIYVLAGLEQLGGVPALDRMTPAELERGLSALRTSLRSTVDLSFFITSAMSKELGRTEIRGVLPVIYLFLVRNGARIERAERIYLDPAGNVQPTPPNAPKDGAPKNGVPGWHLEFTRASGTRHELYYFRQDLTNEALPSKPGLFPFLERLGTVNSFLKAASFILHDKRFSVTRKYLLEHSASILQDDSGIPFKFLSTPAFRLVYFGKYTPSRKVFKDHFQEDMKKAFDNAHTLELPFSTGYKHVEGSNLLLALTSTTTAGSGRR